MALADLMKKGYLTSATATVATPATHRARTRLTAATVAVVAIADDEIFKTATSTAAEVTAANFQDLKPASSAEITALPALVLEFMEEDGLTLAEAQALAAISVQPSPAAQWLAIIAELDGVIDDYCAVMQLTDSTKTAILAARYRQSPASIAGALEWFRHELQGLRSQKVASLSPSTARIGRLSSP
jgi:hypothetical protein